MAVSSYLYPELIPSESGFNILTPTEMQLNSINGVEQITENSGERWYIEMKYNFLRRHEAMELQAHLLRLRGSTNISLIRDQGFTQRGSWAGTPRVNGVNEYGLELDIDGLATNQAIALPCDRFKLGNRVHQVVEAVTTTTNVAATLQLANEIIDIPANNTEIITNPALLTIKARWLRPEEMRQFSGNKSFFKNIRLTFIESLA